MDEVVSALKEKLDRLLKEAAEVSVALDRSAGTFRGTPHYAMIEARAHELGQQLSREIQTQQMGELIAGRIAKAPCPKCGTRCQLKPKERTVTSIDGPVELQELEGHCPVCRRAFFPRQGIVGV